MASAALPRRPRRRRHGPHRIGLLPSFSLRTSGYAGVAAISAALWLGLSPLVYRHGLGMAVSVGLLSPLIAVAPAMPIAVLALFFDIRYWVVFPTGALTGVLVWACLSIGQEGGRGKTKQIAGLPDGHSD